MRLSEKNRFTLETELRSIISAGRYENGIFLDWPTHERLEELDNILSKNQRESLASTLGNSPVSTFLIAGLEQRLKSRHEFRRGHDGFLAELGLATEGVDLAEQLIAELETLPWNYTVSFVLPKQLEALLPPDQICFPLGPKMRIVRFTEELVSKFPCDIEEFEAGFSGLGAALETTPTYEVGCLAIQIDVAGFIGSYSVTPPIQKAETQLKAFFGLLLARHAVQISPSYYKRATGYRMRIHLSYAGRMIQQSSIELDNDVSRLIGKLNVDSLTAGKDKISPLNQLNALAPAFSKQDHVAEKIQLAASWLLNSQANEKDLLAFIQAMVCLEIILGEKSPNSDLSISALIRNRCAYQIARNHKDRENIMKAITEIYDVRSRIVHQGHSWLSSDEAKLLSKLRYYCKFVLFTELALLGDKSP